MRQVVAGIAEAYEQSTNFSFGPDYILPKPMDPRLKMVVSSAVAQAAIATGVSKLPYPQHYPKINDQTDIKHIEPAETVLD